MLGVGGSWPRVRGSRRRGEPQDLGSGSFSVFCGYSLGVCCLQSRQSHGSWLSFWKLCVWTTARETFLRRGRGRRCLLMVSPVLLTLSLFLREHTRALQTHWFCLRGSFFFFFKFIICIYKAKAFGLTIWVVHFPNKNDVRYTLMAYVPFMVTWLIGTTVAAQPLLWVPWDKNQRLLHAPSLD